MFGISRPLQEVDLSRGHPSEQHLGLRLSWALSQSQDLDFSGCVMNGDAADLNQIGGVSCSSLRRQVASFCISRGSREGRQSA